MIKLLIGGSPCTHWSIAQSKNRETKAEGIGWELFLNYVIAKEKFKPDFFLYENNWSASKEIKKQIQHELGQELMRINSSLVSAQNRDRFYVFNWKIEQPEDRGILLKDILETGELMGRKSLDINVSHPEDGGDKMPECQSGTHLMTTVPLVTTLDGKSFCITATEYKGSTPQQTIEKKRRTMVAEPVKQGTEFFVANNKIRQGDKNGSKQGKYVYLPCCEKSNTIGAGQAHNEKVLQRISNISKYKNIYEVEDNKILIKGKWYPIKLRDGKYVIRKLTPVECERLQTLPDGYTAAVSDTQRYKGLGNGWTVEVIIHILQGALQNVPRDEKIVVLSMYDGIGTGRYCLEKMGFTNVEYHAYEIDKYAIKVAMSNYPDIIQHGDAFQVREDDWNLL